MGGGSFSGEMYTSSRATRRAAGLSDFAYSETATKVHPDLDPRRILSKPFRKLESRDSAEHPNANSIFISFDVTGSNYENAVIAQQKLVGLMTFLTKYVEDPQVLIAANDDYNYVRRNAVQISEFESDNRIDDHIRKIWLTRQGGGNDGESYNLMMYAAAYLTILDCMEKRGKRGYFFMYADEPIYTGKQHGRKEHPILDCAQANELQDVFGVPVEANIPITQVIDDLRKLYNVFVIWPEKGYAHALEQYVDLFGRGSVLTLQHPNLICELIGSTIALCEAKATPEALVTDLVHVSGMSLDGARNFTNALLATRPHGGAHTSR